MTQLFLAPLFLIAIYIASNAAQNAANKSYFWAKSRQYSNV